MSLTQLLAIAAFIAVILILEHVQGPPDIDNFENF